MLRYYAIATGIVFAVAILATAWVNRDLIRIKIASVNVAVPPKPAEPLGMGGASEGVLRGDAPWALSALPDCLHQREEATGKLAYVRAQLPAGLAPVAPGSKLTYGPCTISVRDGEAYVTRGSDRLRIPPHVQFYRASGVLALLRSSGSTAELRIYDAVTK